MRIMELREYVIKGVWSVKNWNYLFISVLLAVLLSTTMVVFAVEEENNSGDYSYVFNEDGSIKITKYTGDPVSKEIIVPDEINGKKVTAIERAFLGLVDTERIVLPDTIHEIGERSFEYCTKLSEINMMSEEREEDDPKKARSNPLHRCEAVSV